MCKIKAGWDWDSTTTTRLEVLPEDPIRGRVPGYEASAWLGFWPKNTPAAIVDMLNRKRTRPSPTPRSKHALPSRGFVVLRLGSPADFGKFLVEETEKWARAEVCGHQSLRISQ
jgi:hypothetical protein